MGMRSMLFFVFLSFWSARIIGQTVIDAGEASKQKREGVESTIYQGKPFTGILTERYTNGKPKSWITMKDGLPDGLWQEWYDNGRLKFSAYWQKGKGHGLWEYYHENGVLRQEEFYSLDIPQGVFREFYNNGQVKVKSCWLNGKKQGPWSYFSETGMLTKAEWYDNGLLIPAAK